MVAAAASAVVPAAAVLATAAAGGGGAVATTRTPPPTSAALATTSRREGWAAVTATMPARRRRWRRRRRALRRPSSGGRRRGVHDANRHAAEPDAPRGHGTRRRGRRRRLPRLHVQRDQRRARRSILQLPRAHHALAVGTARAPRAPMLLRRERGARVGASHAHQRCVVVVATAGRSVPSPLLLARARAPLVDLLHDFEEHRLVLLHAAGLEPEPALELALQLAHAQRLVVGLLVEHELDLRLDLRARRHGKIARGAAVHAPTRSRSAARGESGELRRV